jgi:putative Holliday junction resolvase
MRSLIALDYGRRRVGVAACSEALPIAFGITTLLIDSSEDLISQLRGILAERQVTDIVIGVPISLGDHPGMLLPEILDLKSRFESEGLAVHLVDEALSSRKADELLRHRGGKRHREDRDRAAAALILQEYMDGLLPPITEEELMKSRR